MVVAGDVCPSHSLKGDKEREREEEDDGERKQNKKRTRYNLRYKTRRWVSLGKALNTSLPGEG